MAGRIPEQFIDDLLSRVDIVDVIEAHLPLRKAGKEFQALCPFHNEKTPSFTVSREKQFFHCFGCGAHGNTIGFLMQHRSLEFPEAIEELAGMAGVEVPREAGARRSAGTRDLYAVLERARLFYEQQLRRAADRERAVDYLKQRGVTGEIAKRFRLGYAPDGWRNLYDALSADGVGDDPLERAGLVIKRDRGGYYDRLRGRVVFPIHDRRGRVIGFGGRVIDDGEPKYLNSPETDVFHKGRELYGLHETMSAGKPQSLLVVEGYMDVIALHQQGLANAVATLGTAVTGDHLDLMFRFVPEIEFCFDGDNAGRRAAWKALETTLSRLAGNRAVRFVFLPDGHDPDTAVREFGEQGFREQSQTFSLVEFLLETLKRDIDTGSADGRTRLVAQAENYVRQIPDQTHRATAAREIAQVARFDENLVRQRLGISTSRRGPRRAAPELNRYTSRSLEEQALGLLLADPALAALLSPEAAAELESELDTAGTLLTVWQRLQGESLSPAQLLERFRDDPLEDRLHALTVRELDLPGDALEQQFRDALDRLARQAHDKRFERVSRIPFGELTDDQKTFLRQYRRKPTSGAPS